MMVTSPLCWLHLAKSSLFSSEMRGLDENSGSKSEATTNDTQLHMFICVNNLICVCMYTMILYDPICFHILKILTTGDMQPNTCSQRVDNSSSRKQGRSRPSVSASILGHK